MTKEVKRKIATIKYTVKDEESMILESKWFTATKYPKTEGNKYCVRLYLDNPNNLRYNVISEDGTAIRNGNGYTNMNVLYRYAKRAIEELGVEFNKLHGKVDRTFGLCEKGYSQKEHLRRKYEKRRFKDSDKKTT